MAPFVSGISQKIARSTEAGIAEEKELNGIVLDYDTKLPLLYSTIYLHDNSKGTISNESGFFSINIDGLDKKDTLFFQYVGYKTRGVTLSELAADSVVYLKEEIVNLSELLVFATEPDPKDIIKNVLKNRESNYPKAASKKQTFIRTRDIATIDNFDLDFKKSSIPDLDRETIQGAEQKIPKNTTSFTDFLGEIYFNGEESKKGILKIDPIKMVSLKEDDIAESGQLAKAFEKALTNTTENEYWKIKSGIFSQKIDEEELNVSDSLGNIGEKSTNYSTLLKEQVAFSQLYNKREWEFLHSTGKYNYTFEGGTRVNGEDVYIINFTPKENGLYIGKVFIAINSFALIRADFEYARGKIGTDVNLLGMGYTENDFHGSIFFEKHGDAYKLKYFSRKVGFNVRFERNLALIKKKEKTLFDKKVDEIKVDLKLNVNLEESVEFLVLDDETISDQQFISFKQPPYVKTIFVNQFDDTLWADFNIIEPTEQMKEYKKAND